MKSFGILAIAVLTITFLAAPAMAGGPDQQQGCDNYGINNQVTVYGDNNAYNCQLMYCDQGAGAGGAGAAVGTTNAKNGDVGVQTSAGTGCSQSECNKATTQGLGNLNNPPPMPPTSVSMPNGGATEQVWGHIDGTVAAVKDMIFVPNPPTCG